MKHRGSSNTSVVTGALQSNKYLAKLAVERFTRATDRTQKFWRRKQYHIVDSDVSYAGNLKFCKRIDACERSYSPVHTVSHPEERHKTATASRGETLIPAASSASSVMPFTAALRK